MMVRSFVRDLKFLLFVILIGCSGSDDGGTTSGPPSAPTDLHILSTTATSVQMQWTDNATDEDAYYVERSPVNNQSYQQIATLAPNIFAYYDAGLTSGSTYFYRVRAGRGGSFSTYSNEIVAVAVPNVPPQFPEVIYPANGATNISLSPTLRWSANDADGDPLLFDVFFGKQPNPPLVSGNLPEASLQRTGLDTNTVYYWKVVAKDSYLETSGPVWTFRTGFGGPSIAVIYPNGGETLIADFSAAILWTSDQLIGTVDILLSTDGGNNWPYVVASNATNTGSFVWSLTQTYGPSCRLRIQSSANPEVYDESDGDFAVRSSWWVAQDSGTNAELRDVAFTDASNGWAVGDWAVGWDEGTILHTTNGGVSWEAQNSGAYGSLYGVAFTDANNGWAVGGDAFETILHTSNGGASWASLSSGRFVGLMGVAFTDASNGWMVGRNGWVVHTSNGGISWEAQNSGALTWLNGVAFTDASNGWAVGGPNPNNGTIILHTANGGVNWFTQNSGTEFPLNGVTFTDTNNGWVVGDHGTILHTTNGGVNWFTQNSGTNEELRDVAFTDASNGWVVGYEGTILHTTNGGVSWVRLNSGTSVRLNGVVFTAANNGWVVGDDGTILKW